jgi:hypothetical protein
MGLLNKENKKGIISFNPIVDSTINKIFSLSKETRNAIVSAVREFVTDNIMVIFKDEKFALRGLAKALQIGVKNIDYDQVKIEYSCTRKNRISILITYSSPMGIIFLMNIDIRMADEDAFWYLRGLLITNKLPKGLFVMSSML